MLIHASSAADVSCFLKKTRGEVCELSKQSKNYLTIERSGSDGLKAQATDPSIDINKLENLLRVSHAKEVRAVAKVKMRKVW